MNGHLPYQRTKILKESARTSQRAASLFPVLPDKFGFNDLW
jgi:hypothetical protein